MIRKLLATTALATLVASGAWAQEAPAPADPAQPAQMEQDAAPVVRAEGNLATQIIGENVYSGTGDDAQHIGDVNDFVIGADGKIELVVVGVGGFLGIGQKEVALDFAQLEWAERDGDRWLVAPTTKEQLEQQATFDRAAFEPQRTTAATDMPAAPGVAPAPDTTAQAPAEQPVPDTTAQAPAESAPDATAEAPAQPAPDTTAEAPADTTQSEQMTQDQAQAPDAATDTTTTAAIDRSTLKDLPAEEVRAEEMIGTTVYGADDGTVGEIGDIVLSADGKIDAYIVDVGGFLGIGEKEVAIGSDNLAFMVDDRGNKYLYTTFTKEQLDAAPAYDESTYVERRDEQRVLVR